MSKVIYYCSISLSVFDNTNKNVVKGQTCPHYVRAVLI